MDDSDQLLLLYQPIHDARSGAIIAAEALLRQRRETGEIREASIIHETAENSSGGELFVLDSLVMKKAYTAAAQWQATFPGVRLNVNLSPREFQEGDVVERLKALLSECGTEPTKVNIEITEASYIDDPQQTTRILETLKEWGMDLWLDDFGTRHSTIAHLQHFPVDGLKLPGEFVEPLPGSSRCCAITRGLITLAHDLGLRVIAEGVETREQLDVLVEQGCDYVQGFYFSRPMKLEQFEEMLAERVVASSSRRVVESSSRRAKS